MLIRLTKPFANYESGQYLDNSNSTTAAMQSALTAGAATQLPETPVKVRLRANLSNPALPASFYAGEVVSAPAQIPLALAYQITTQDHHFTQYGDLIP